MSLQKPGNTFISLLVFSLIVISIFSGLIFVLNQLHILPKFGDEVVQENQYEKSNILRTFDFKNSKGKKKKLIIYKSHADIVVPVVDTYIVDDNLSKTGSIKIDELSNDNSLVHADKVPVGQQGLLISSSKGGEKTYILISTTVADATSMTIIDEDGNVVSQRVIDNVYSMIKDMCHCSYRFADWDDSKFYISVETKFGEKFKVLIDAKNGSVIGNIQKA